MRVTSAILAALAVGCGGNVELPPGAASGGAGGADGATPDAADATAAPDSPKDSPVEDVQTPDDKYAYVCKDGGAPGPGYMSCCNGHVCLGTCENGSCHCGGITGGCELPSICCSLSEEGPVVCGGYGVCLPQK